MLSFVCSASLVAAAMAGPRPGTWKSHRRARGRNDTTTCAKMLQWKLSTARHNWPLMALTGSSRLPIVRMAAPGGKTVALWAERLADEERKFFDAS